VSRVGEGPAPLLLGPYNSASVKPAEQIPRPHDKPFGKMKRNEVRPRNGMSLFWQLLIDRQQSRGGTKHLFQDVSPVDTSVRARVYSCRKNAISNLSS